MIRVLGGVCITTCAKEETGSYSSHPMVESGCCSVDWQEEKEGLKVGLYKIIATSFNIKWIFWISVMNCSEVALFWKPVGGRIHLKK